MSKSLIEIQDVLESGNKISHRDVLAISRGFIDFNEYSRYRKWRKNEGKSTSYEADDFMSDLEWWRTHVDYATVSVFMEYAKQNGYIITQKNLDKFNRWKSHNKLSHSNKKEYLELYIVWLNVLSKRKLFEESLSNLSVGSRRDAIAMSLGFKDNKQRNAYNKACYKLGFSYSSDRDRYLSGIAEWIEQRENPKNSGRHNRHSLRVSDFFSSKKEQAYFSGWCARSGMVLHLLTDKELKNAVDLYKEERSYLERKRNLPLKDDYQWERYTRYCVKHGFSFKEDPERCLSEFQNWADNIDAEESNNYLRYCELFEHLLSGKEGCEESDDTIKELTELFDSIVEKYYFYKWCSSINKVITTKEELLSAINLYRKLGECKIKLKEIHWVTPSQKVRYYRYCKNLGFSFTSDPVRYLEGLEEWAEVIDGNPIVC